MTISLILQSDHSQQVRDVPGAVPSSSTKFARFVADFEVLLDEARADEPRIRRDGARLLAELVRNDDWLPASHARPGADTYRQYPLHRDAAGRFSVVSFVWGPGQSTPIHDHTVWGLIGVLRGAEQSQAYRFVGLQQLRPTGPPVRLEAGAIEAVSPSVGDIHRVHNPHADRVAISIHVYGADIVTVQRSTYTEDGQRRPFVSGYSPLA